MKSAPESEKKAREARAARVATLQRALYSSGWREAEAVGSEPARHRLAWTLEWLSGASHEIEGWDSPSGERASERLLSWCSGPGMARGLAASVMGEMEIEGEPGGSALAYLTRFVAEPRVLKKGACANAAENFMWFAMQEPAASESLLAGACRALINSRRGLDGVSGPMQEGALKQVGSTLQRLAGSSLADAREAFEALGAVCVKMPEAIGSWAGWGAPFTSDSAVGAFIELSQMNRLKSEIDRAEAALSLLSDWESRGMWKAGFGEAVAADARVGGVERSALEELLLSAAVDGAAAGAGRPSLRV